MVQCWRKAAAAIGFAAGIALAQSSHAATIDWSLSGGTFDDGSTFSGSFSLDTTSGVITTWNIATTAGSAVFGDTYAPGAGQSATASGSSVIFGGAGPNESLTLTGFSPGTPGTFAPLGGGELHEDLFGDGILSRGIAGGTPASLVQGSAAPEPASWVLLIAGFGATGALLRRRRSQAVA
jgi:hypothetical protein